MGGAKLGYVLDFGHVESAQLCEAGNMGGEGELQLDLIWGVTTIRRVRTILSSSHFLAPLPNLMTCRGRKIRLEAMIRWLPPGWTLLLDSYLGVSTIRLGSPAGCRGRAHAVGTNDMSRRMRNNGAAMSTNGACMTN